MGHSKSLPESGVPNLPATGWVVLGALTFGEAVSGYDIKKWVDWSASHFYWSPSHSQIYSELKRLESRGYATSTQHDDNAMRRLRLYQITDAGLAAARQWAAEAAVDPPMLKHSVLLRVWLGHLNEPERLKEMLRDHVAYIDDRRRRVSFDGQAAELEPAWTYPRIAMKWSERYYAAERDLTLQLIEDIETAQTLLGHVDSGSGCAFPTPKPGHWREIENRVQRQDPTASSV